MFFNYFPEVKYGDAVTRDITRHISFIEDLEKNPYVYLPYTLSDGERAQDVSFHYYGTVDYTPFILMANRVVNPYTDWFMSPEDLNRHLTKKYAKASGSKGSDVLRWATNATRFDNIVHFVAYNDETRIMNPDTYIDLYVPTGQKNAFYTKPKTVTYTGFVQDWVPVRVMEHEVALNEEKRTVNVIDAALIGSVANRFRDLIRG